MLTEHTWPGNVRELRNVVERAVILANDEVLAPADITLSHIPSVPESEDEIVSEADAERPHRTRATPLRPRRRRRRGRLLCTSHRRRGFTRRTRRATCRPFLKSAAGTNPRRRVCSASNAQRSTAVSRNTACSGPIRARSKLGACENGHAARESGPIHFVDARLYAWSGPVAESGEASGCTIVPTRSPATAR